MNWKTGLRRELGAISRQMMFLHGYLPVAATEPPEVHRAVPAQGARAPRLPDAHTPVVAWAAGRTLNRSARRAAPR